MAKADPGRHKPLGQVLKEMELVSEGQIQESLQISASRAASSAKILVNLGYVAREEILLALAAQMGMEVVDLDEIEIDPVVINKVPTNLASPTTSSRSSSRTGSSPSRCRTRTT